MRKLTTRSRRRSGMSMIYIIVALVAMLGFCSFAVDLGRVQTAKTELRRAADAAARAGVANIMMGSTAVQNAAIAIAASNKCDGSSVVISSSDVKTGIWNKSTSTFSTSGTADNITTFNAVQITASRTKAKGNPIPLLFGQILGANTCNVTATSVAALISTTAPITQYVSAHGNPWLAGEPKGTLGSVPDDSYMSQDHPWKNDIANPNKVDTATNTYTDSKKVSSGDYSTGQPWGSPVSYSVTPGAVIQISVPTSGTGSTATNAGFLDDTGSGIDTTPDGNNNGSYNIYSDDAANPSLAQGTVTTSGSEHGISNIATPLNSLTGVFLDSNASTEGADNASGETVPTGLDFSTQTARDYTALEPQLNQSFYVGTGQTSSGVQQTIVVPNGAYELFLGTMDGHEWSNNQGGFNATITQFYVEIVH